MGFSRIASQVGDALSVRSVFGEPIERDGLTVVPVANLRGAFGGGEGPAEQAGTGASWGGGLGWSATPAGAYVIRGGEVTWVPAVDANRTIVLGCGVAVVALLVLRSVVRTVGRRPISSAA